jgi:hypothetical protein
VEEKLPVKPPRAAVSLLTQRTHARKERYSISELGKTLTEKPSLVHGLYRIGELANGILR